MLSALVGHPVAELDTPALVIDIDAMDRNIARIAGALRDAGVQWRPHAKGHNTPAIAHRQLAAGAIGVTCAKLGAAEVMAASGIRDILVANQIVGPIKTRRLGALLASSGADVAVAVDDACALDALDAAGAEFGVKPRIVIEVETGMSRAGAAAGAPTVALAQEIARRKHLRFAGVMAWEGHAVSIPDRVERIPAIERAVGLLTETAAAIRDAGLPVEIVSCGGSGTYLTTSQLPGVTEVQAGGATLGDGFYRELDAPVEPALTLLTQVTSRPAPDRIIIDAGRKSIDPSLRPPFAPDLVGVTGMGFSAEHGTIRLDRPNRDLRPGDRLALQVGYHDQAVHLHEALYAVRDGVIVAVWPTLARGKLN
ncbi:MAG TPA: alanine racemase [Thermomicrobiales bacterium]|nr:alanine racemase [Thermomicrobiales bacterium]